MNINRILVVLLFVCLHTIVKSEGCNYHDDTDIKGCSPPPPPQKENYCTVQYKSAEDRKLPRKYKYCDTNCDCDFKHTQNDENTCVKCLDTEPFDTD